MENNFDYNYLVKGTIKRRDFLKNVGFSASALALGQIIDVPFIYAKDLYPSSKIQYLVPQGPGGGYDILARAVTQYIAKYLQTLVPGARGPGIVVRNEERKVYNILCNAKPDGYTIGLMDSSIYVDNLLGEAKEDVTKFTFLHAIASGGKVVIANTKGFNSWNEAVNAQNKRIIKMGVGYYSRSNHICAIILNEKVGTKFKLIPFRGTSECLGAMLRGDVDISMVSEDSVKPLIDAKEIRVLLSFSDHADYPEAITIKELGYPEMVDLIAAHRIQVGPPKLAAEPKRLLIEAMKKSCDDPAFMAWAKTRDYEIKRLFGDDAEKFFMKLVKFYNGIAPILKKHLT